MFHDSFWAFYDSRNLDVDLLPLVHAGKAGAGDRIRTGDIDLGKVALYQLSYSRSVEKSIVHQKHSRCQTLPLNITIRCFYNLVGNA